YFRKHGNRIFHPRRQRRQLHYGGVPVRTRIQGCAEKFEAFRELECVHGCGALVERARSELRQAFVTCRVVRCTGINNGQSCHDGQRVNGRDNDAQSVRQSVSFESRKLIRARSTRCRPWMSWRKGARGHAPTSTSSAASASMALS